LKLRSPHIGGSDRRVEAELNPNQRDGQVQHTTIPAPDSRTREKVPPASPQDLRKKKHDEDVRRRWREVEGEVEQEVEARRRRARGRTSS